MENRPYRDPKVVRAKRGWFIALWHERPGLPGEYRRFEISAGINRIHDLAEREREINKLLKALRTELSRGLNPFFPEEHDRFVGIIEHKEAAAVAVSDALDSTWRLDRAFDEFLSHCRKKNLSQNTVRTYETFIGNFRLWLAGSPGLADLRAREVDADLVARCLDEMSEEEEWSPRTYNNHLKFFTTFFNRASRLERISGSGAEYRLDLSDVDLKVSRAEKNRYYTPDVAASVKEHLKRNAELERYVGWIYYSCMRPREIGLLQVRHIDLKRRQIKAIAPTAKTGDRFVPICDELFEMIEGMGLRDFPQGHYVFGRGGPSAGPVAKNYFSAQYRSVRDALGLDDKYTLYGWKHTRVVDLLSAGFSDHEVMTLTGHRDYKSFEAYKRDLVLDASKMKGRTIGF